ncbi:polyprotein [Elysia marginata]|uniref:Polyprotein n=1 Tax=Elysia marginata TaxID=1093978 RepID=A0AAV4J6B8_9GAST|nr:polyprotein [Elysia marginata]
MACWRCLRNDKHLSEKENIKKAIHELRKNIQEEFEGTTAELEKQIDNFSLQVHQKKKEQEKKRAVLLTVIGPTQFRLLKDLTAPESPATKTYDELCQALKSHHAPTPPKYLCRAKFDQRTRQPNESISSFIAALRHLSEHCEFGSTLNERLCEKFVTGVNHVEIQRKLILETNLTLDKAIQIATSQLQSSEAARALVPPAVNALHDKASKPPWNQRQNQKTGNHHHPSTRPGKLGHRCNGPHSAQQCKFKKVTTATKWGTLPKPAYL